MTTSATEMIAQRLVAIKDEITPDDRKGAANDLKISHPTITSYLKGEIKNADLAVRMYEYFTGRINDRIERIRSIA